DDLALGDLEVGVPHDHVREGGLARAVRAHEGVDLALVHGQVEALEDLLVPGAHVQVLDLEFSHVSSCVVGGQAAAVGAASGLVCASANSTSSASVVPW